MNPSSPFDKLINEHDRTILLAAAEMVRLFDGYSVTPHYDWVAVRDGIAKMIEEMAERIK